MPPSGELCRGRSIRRRLKNCSRDNDLDPMTFPRVMRHARKFVTYSRTIRRKLTCGATGPAMRAADEPTTISRPTLRCCAHACLRASPCDKVACRPAENCRASNRDMDINLATTFLEIVSCRSFAAAAERLHVTQTAVSARIRHLEELLGQPVFVRNKSGASITAAGKRFMPYAVSLVQVWERARLQVAVPPGRRGVIRRARPAATA